MVLVPWWLSSGGVPVGSGWVRGAKGRAEPRLAQRVCRGRRLLSPFPPSDADILLSRLKSHLQIAPLSSPSFGRIKVTGRGHHRVRWEGEQGRRWDFCGAEPCNRKGTDFLKKYFYKIYTSTKEPETKIRTMTSFSEKHLKF